MRSIPFTPAILNVLSRGRVQIGRVEPPEDPNPRTDSRIRGPEKLAGTLHVLPDDHPLLRYLALNDTGIAVTSRPRLSPEYVYVASDQRKERQANRAVKRKC